MKNNEITIGKHTLESLTVGMYTEPFTIYREYIQNATDAIDSAIKQKIIKENDAIIHVTVNKRNSTISINDNGTGISSDRSYKILGNIGNSEKDYRENRGFRGIGRLGGLAYAEYLKFITTTKGSAHKSIITWDCNKLKELLQPGKYKDYDLIKVIKEVTSLTTEDADKDDHFFEVELEKIYPQFKDLLDEKQVEYYLSTVAPVPFDHQKFIYATEIKEKIQNCKMPLEEYKIILNNSPNPITKMYKTHFKTGHQERNKKEDYITSIEFFDIYNEKEDLLLIGWHAISKFYGSVQDHYMKGIRIRKGNILIGDENTFNQFFKSEKDVANSWFIGEIYIYDINIIPNARRDDFEKNSDFKELYSKLSDKADELNRNFRRGMSKYNSLIKTIDICKNKQEEIKQQIENEGITSDIRRDQLLKDKDEIEKKIQSNKKEISKIIEKSKKNKDNEQSANVSKLLNECDSIQKNNIEIENKIINAFYATKDDLPSSYSKDERKLYQRIIKVIDENVDKDTANLLRRKIIEELTKKKSKS